ncbi:MAG: hypothetical protein MUC49_16460 [Raineya sp.]|jgi:hypothetical protein|nr:hypothetical protein [Raineya sp.]
MEDYKFKYKPNPITLKERINLFISNLIFKLYQNKIFKKLKLDKNIFIKYYVNKEIKLTEENKIPENPAIIPYSLTFCDVFDFENFLKEKNTFIKLFSQYKTGWPAKKPREEIDKCFVGLENAYKTVAFGEMYYNNLQGVANVDLIDGISYKYIKGEQSKIILIYEIYPSQKFKDLFKKIFKLQMQEKYQILLSPLIDVFKFKKIKAYTSTQYTFPSIHFQILFDEVNYQLKKYIVKDLKKGVFGNKKRVLFPSIVTFEYEADKTAEYMEDILLKLGISNMTIYSKDTTMIYLPDNQLESMMMFISKHKDNESESQIEKSLASVSYLSGSYLNAVLPFWASLGIIEFFKSKYVMFRKEIYTYLSHNKDSIFLSKAIRIKKEFNLYFLQLKVIKKDFSSKIYNYYLNNKDFPDLENKQRTQNKFKQEIVKNRDYSISELMKSFEEIEETFKSISNDNLVKANMRLQKILLLMSSLGALLTIYGANAKWFNEKLYNLVKHLFS